MRSIGKKPGYAPVAVVVYLPEAWAITDALANTIPRLAPFRHLSLQKYRVVEGKLERVDFAALFNRHQVKPEILQRRENDEISLDGRFGLLSGISASGFRGLLHSARRPGCRRV